MSTVYKKTSVLNSILNIISRIMSEGCAEVKKSSKQCDSEFVNVLLSEMRVLTKIQYTQNCVAKTLH